AHRTPDKAAEFAKSAESNGYGVIIAAAGKAAHLAGVLAAYTPLPVIGVPIKSSTMDGLDSLLSTVQMPSGIPVATVAIDGAENAALLAIQILSVADEELREKIREYKKQLVLKVEEKNTALKEILIKEGL
ncbi:MAG TPA: 5-(carboxyamino)imidazole ribonucleotide mutase, partial [Clostridiaceae bacterium]|nr:5-(carboxyamino)imidazole ribonucleotide mutase [Clostridiaceae bacterium]